MSYHINKFTCLIGLTLSVVSGRLPLIIEFMQNHEGFFLDVCIFSFLNGGGQLFIYRMIKEFRQHITPFVVAFRKCLTVLINIFWFHHLVNWHQMMGIGFVFSAVMWEVWSNYQEKKDKIPDEKHISIPKKEN
jgi:drug/metabolite transporter (DMT)-like permease